MSADPNLCICSVCGMMDAENYDDCNTCAYCGGELIDTGKTKSQHGLYNHDVSKNALSDIKLEYIYKNDKYNSSIKDIVIEEMGGFSIYGCRALSFCHSCGSVNVKSAPLYCKIRGHWLFSRYVNHINVQNTCLDCGYKWNMVQSTTPSQSGKCTLTQYLSLNKSSSEIYNELCHSCPACHIKELKDSF